MFSLCNLAADGLHKRRHTNVFMAIGEQITATQLSLRTQCPQKVCINTNTCLIECCATDADSFRQVSSPTIQIEQSKVSPCRCQPIPCTHFATLWTPAGNTLLFQKHTHCIRGTAELLDYSKMLHPFPFICFSHFIGRVPAFLTVFYFMIITQKHSGVKLWLCHRVWYEQQLKCWQTLAGILGRCSLTFTPDNCCDKPRDRKSVV